MADQPYRPSNGTEGEIFMEAWCGRCVREKTCDIIGRTMALPVSDPRYPVEWRCRWEPDFHAWCTAYVPVGTGGGDDGERRAA